MVIEGSIALCVEYDVFKTILFSFFLRCAPFRPVHGSERETSGGRYFAGESGIMVGFQLVF